jgi:hypothetical protein
MQFFNLFHKEPLTDIDSFLQSAHSEKWDYMKAINIKQQHLQQATHEQLMDNPVDIANGVVKVEMLFGHSFFDVFNNLIIKHHDDGEIRLMFYSDVFSLDTIMTFYDRVKSNLGLGIIYNPKFSSFKEVDKVRQLTKGTYNTKSDEILQSWYKQPFSFTLNYKIEPLRQLMFIVSNKSQKSQDFSQRNIGTLIKLLKHSPYEFFEETEIDAEPFFEEEKIKFIDYTFKLDPPEFKVFDQAKIRIFGIEKDLSNNKSMLVTYVSNDTIDTSTMIEICNKLVKIYGPDDAGYSELRPHEIDRLNDNEYWTGRSWFMNRNHQLQNFKDPNQNTLYWVSFTSNPEEGTTLSILGYDDMLAYQQKIDS